MTEDENLTYLLRIPSALILTKQMRRIDHGKVGLLVEKKTVNLSANYERNNETYSEREHLRENVHRATRSASQAILSLKMSSPFLTTLSKADVKRLAPNLLEKKFQKKKSSKNKLKKTLLFISLEALFASSGVPKQTNPNLNKQEISIRRTRKETYFFRTL